MKYNLMRCENQWTNIPCCLHWRGSSCLTSTLQQRHVYLSSRQNDSSPGGCTCRCRHTSVRPLTLKSNSKKNVEHINLLRILLYGSQRHRVKASDRAIKSSNFQIERTRTPTTIFIFPVLFLIHSEMMQVTKSYSKNNISNYSRLSTKKICSYGAQSIRTSLRPRFIN